MGDPTNTLDLTFSDTWEALVEEPAQAPLEPRIRILYHVDLERVGWYSEPDIPLTVGEWQILGRKQPLFWAPREGARARPLENPTLSRQQARVRWLAGDEVFEVEPRPAARRALQWLDERGALRPLTARTRLPPGSCVAIEDRVLFALERARPRASHEDRLGFVGESAAMWRLRDAIVELARFSGSVLVLGPTGAGKELVARALHRHGARADRPFLTVNCAALPEQRVESILFGHVKGAFTGAGAEQRGMFRAADGGVLFLDELGEMPMSVQPKLLRVLEDGQVAPVGGHHGTRVDVLLVAATNREPTREIAAGRMREDLYYRVARHVLRIPPLSARRSDIPELFARFLLAAREEHPGLEWMFEAARGWRRVIPLSLFVHLLRGAFPGNVRQLRNLAEQTARLNLAPGRFRAPELPPPADGSRAEERPLAGRSSDARERRPSDARGDPVADAERGSGVARSSAAVPGASTDEGAAARLAAASRALGLAQKTVSKLVQEPALRRIHDDVTGAGAGAGADALREQLVAHARARIERVMAAHEHNKRRVASALGVSPTTLMKVMSLTASTRSPDES